MNKPESSEPASEKSSFGFLDLDLLHRTRWKVMRAKMTYENLNTGIFQSNLMFVVVRLRLKLLNLNLILNCVRFDKYKQFKLDLEKN